VRAVLLALVVLVSGCAKRDLDGVCKLAQEILTEPRIGPSERFERLLTQAKNNAFGGDVRALMADVAVAPPDMRAALFEQGASELLGKPWSCAPLRIVLSQ
jgi:hypothetical protein